MQKFEFIKREWRVLEEFPRYEINSLGIIRHRHNQIEHSVNVGDYETVLLTRDGKRYHRSVRRLVAKTFPEFQ